MERLLNRYHIQEKCLFCFGFTVLTFFCERMIFNHNIDVYLWMWLPILVCLLLVGKIINAGIYIHENRLYYKNISVREIDITNIKGIVVMEYQNIHGTRGYDYKDSNGERIFSAMFVSHITPQMKNYFGGNVEFNREFQKKGYMFEMAYDMDGVNKIIQMAPHIKLYICDKEVKKEYESKYGVLKDGLGT